MKSQAKVVDEADYGVYLWQMPNGQYVGDDQQNFLSVSAMKGDIQKIAALRRAVAEFDIHVGEPVFLAGRRKITDEEYEEQKERMKEGLIADPYDFGAIRDQLRADGQ
jgi:hypothetical protein